MNKIEHKISLKIKILRFLWNITHFFLIKFSPRPFHIWRFLILKLFGANIHYTSIVYPSVKIWAPWNLVMKKKSCLGDNVDCYNVGKIFIGENSIISQYSFLCTATKDNSTGSLSSKLFAAPITVGENSWVAADVFIAPGVKIGNNVIITARCSIFESIDDNTKVKTDQKLLLVK